MNFLLEVTDYTVPISNLTDKFLFGGKMVLIGMATVFAVLFILWISLLVFKFVFHDVGSRKTKTKEIKNTDTPVFTPHYANANDEIVAVIAAAIATAESESAPGSKFRVVSFKRK